MFHKTKNPNKPRKVTAKGYHYVIWEEELYIYTTRTPAICFAVWNKIRCLLSVSSEYKQIWMAFHQIWGTAMQ